MELEVTSFILTLSTEECEGQFGKVRLYRDQNLDWYRSFFEAFGYANSDKILDSKLLYFGPGFAQEWRHRSQNVIIPGNLRSLYETAVSRLVLPNLGTEGLTLIDLGVGDFYKGYVLLDRLLQRGVEELNYFFYDISYEMLVSVINTTAAEFKQVLKTVNDNGTLAAVNADFHQRDCYSVIPVSPRRCFGLLGNTLGSDLQAEQLLATIRNEMFADDVLVAELQLMEEEPPSDAELLRHFSITKSFYTGPFMAAGSSDSNLELDVRTELSEQYATVHVICRVIKSFEYNIESVGFGRTIPAGEYSVLQIRKYNSQFLERMLDASGFQIIDCYLTPSAPGARTFGYLAARRRPFPSSSDPRSYL